jgi:hypothetical protein
MKLDYNKGTCSPTFIEALFTIAKIWKQTRWYLYTMEFYTATKKNEILSFTGKWIELENIILSEIIQVQKAKNLMFSLICGIQT